MAIHISIPGSFFIIRGLSYPKTPKSEKSDFSETVSLSILFCKSTPMVNMWKIKNLPVFYAAPFQMENRWKARDNSAR